MAGESSPYLLAAPADSPWPSWLVDGSQVVGAFIGVVALIVAAVALYRAEVGLVRERRIAHELEVLRGLASINTFSDLLHAAVTVHSALVLLPSLADFPITRAAIGLETTEEARRTYTECYPDLPPLVDGMIDSRRFAALTDGTFFREWQEAVNRRLAQSRL